MKSSAKTQMSEPEKLIYILELNRFIANTQSPQNQILQEATHLILVDHNQLTELGDTQIPFAENISRLLFEIQNLNLYKRDKQQFSMVYKPRNLKYCGNPHCQKQLTEFSDDWQVFFITCNYKNIKTKIGIASCEDELCLETCRNTMVELNEIIIQKNTQ